MEQLDTRKRRMAFPGTLIEWRDGELLDEYVRQLQLAAAGDREALHDCWTINPGGRDAVARDIEELRWIEGQLAKIVDDAQNDAETTDAENAVEELIEQREVIEEQLRKAEGRLRVVKDARSTSNFARTIMDSQIHARSKPARLAFGRELAAKGVAVKY